jgi:hypothetical protein
MVCPLLCKTGKESRASLPRRATVHLEKGRLLLKEARASVSVGDDTQTKQDTQTA